MQDALYPNLRPWRVISNESRLLFIVFKIGLVEQGIKQDLQIFIDFVEADRYYPSSKLCSCCGCIKKDLKLNDRIYKCSCGLNINRDYNASINLSRYKLAI